MKAASLLLSGLSLAPLSAACDKPTPVSCMVRIQVGDAVPRQQCSEYVGKRHVELSRKTCNQQEGREVTKVFSERPCPGEGVLASCRSDAETEWEWVDHCYAPDTLKDCETRCAGINGRFEKR